MSDFVRTWAVMIIPNRGMPFRAGSSQRTATRWKGPYVSVEIHVLLSKSRLPDVRQWQAAIDALGFDVRLDPSLMVGSGGGFVPACFNGRDSGFEFDTSSAIDVLKVCPDFEREFGGCDCSANFRVGSDLTELACAMIAAAALARLGEGVLFDPQEGACLGPTDAVEQARTIAAEAEE